MANLRDNFAPEEHLVPLTPSARPSSGATPTPEPALPGSQTAPGQLNYAPTPDRTRINPPQTTSPTSAPERPESGLQPQETAPPAPSENSDRSAPGPHRLPSRNHSDAHHLAGRLDKKRLTGSIKKQLMRRGVAAGLAAVAAEGVVVLLVVVVLFAAAMSFTGSGGVDDSYACTADCGVNGDVVATAKQFAWETEGHGFGQSDAKPAYIAAMKKFNPHTTEFPYSDCGVYTATTMRASGIDPSYAGRGTGLQWDYVTAHPGKYKIIDISSTADLQPGDILFKGAGGGGHTSLYIGPQPEGDPFHGRVVLSASLETERSNGHVPQVSTWYPTMSKAARFIGGAQ